MEQDTLHFRRTPRVMGQKGRLTRILGLLTIGALMSAGLSAQGAGARTARRSPSASIKVRHRVTQPVFSYKNAIRETIYIESEMDDDGKPGKDLLATDIIRPKATKTDSSFDVPVIYEMSPYYQHIHGSGAVQLGRGNEHEVKEDEDGDFVPHFFPLFYDNYFVPRGYAVVLQDMPGTRNSEGCMVLGGNGELAAAKATMAWLRGKGKAYRLNPTTGLPDEEVKANWSAGRVGMIGKSYDGTISNAAASMGLKGLKTIVPISGISSWYDYMYNRGVQYSGNAATAPLFTFYIDQPPADDNEAIGKWVTATFGENSVCEAKGSDVAAEAGNPTGDYTNFWAERDYLRHPKNPPDSIKYSSKAGNVKASVFIAHGRNDFNVKPQNWVQWYKALKRHGVPHKLWLSQTGHVDPFDYRRAKFVHTLHKWFDRWLWGLNNGIMSQPTVDIERKADKWKTYKEWPAPRVRRVKLWLNPGDKKRPGILKRRRARKGKSQTYTDDPNQSESSMASGPKKSDPNRIIFLTKKLNRKVRVSGEFPIKLKASLDKVDTNFTYLLVDYGKGVRVNHEGSGEGITTTQQENCWGASIPQDDACYFITKKVVVSTPYEIVTRGWLDAKHRKGLRNSQPLTPGQAYGFKWKGMGEDYIFKKGHRIGVVVAGGDSTFTVPDGQDAEVTVKLRASHVTLPVVGRSGRIKF